MADGIETLTEKEKETLRLVLRGHDAKSMATHLGLSVHTVNERLRPARRKLEVTSSREAARMLARHEPMAPQTLVPKQLGEAAVGQVPDNPPRLDEPGQRRRNLFVAACGGFIIMSLSLTLLLLASSLGGSDAPDPQESRSSAVASADAVAEQAARNWLAMVDAEDWQGSFDAAGKQFKEPNTVETWREASSLARGSFGPVLNRAIIGVQTVNAPPHGYIVVRFQTDFQNRAGVVENVTLEDEGDAWRVVGYFLT